MIKDEIRDAYNRVGGQWREKVWVNDSDFRSQIVQFARISEGVSLLDVGTGAGDLPSLFSGIQVTGIDISESMIAEGKRLHPDYVFSVGDAEHLPYPDASFDVVTCRNLLQNFINPKHAFAEMFRVLKPGGSMFVVESAVYRGEEQFPTDFCRIAEPFHPLFPTHEGLHELFEQAGLHDIRQEVAAVEKKWLAKWQRSKGSTQEERVQGYDLCARYPDWYKEKYAFTFFPEEIDIQSRLTFSFLHGVKPRVL
jgi:SAM-dependent methyltransferase